MTGSDQQIAGSFAGELGAVARDIVRYAGRRGIVAVLFVALGATLEGLSLALIVPLLAIVTGAGTSFGRLEIAAAAAFRLFGIATPFGRLALLLALFGAVMILRAIVIYIRDTTVADLQSGFVEAQRLRIAERLAAAPWDRVARLRHARITHVMSADIQRVGMAANFMLQSIVAASMLLAQCVLVFLLAPALALVALAVLVFGGVMVVPLIRRAYGLGGIVTGANLNLLNLTGQFLDGLKLAISQNLQAGFLAEFRQTVGELRRRRVQYLRQQTNSRLVLATLSALAGGLLVLIGFGVFQVAPPTLIVLLLVIGRMSGPVGQLQLGAQQLAHALPACKAVRDLERELTAIPHEPHVHADLPALREGPAVFENVAFLHAAGEDGGQARGIRGLNLTIAPHEFLGVSGPSGAGKTTFADLLVGLFPPQQGRITVGGVELQGAALTAWRDRIGYISQDPFLFHDTVRRNLAWANPQASEADMWAALALAGADTLVRRMEQGPETIVGQRGTLVSGGERQRLALARAILRKPQLLVMDEATSAIDVAGEREILAHLRALDPRPTIVMIAHRAESLALCDRIVRLEAGRSVEETARAPAARAGPLRVVD